MEVQQHCAEVAHCSEQNAVKKMEVKKKNLTVMEVGGLL